MTDPRAPSPSRSAAPPSSRSHDRTDPGAPPKPKKVKLSGGFKWKDSSSGRDADPSDRRDGRGSQALERGYRARSPPRRRRREEDDDDKDRRDDSDRAQQQQQQQQRRRERSPPAPRPREDASAAAAADGPAPARADVRSKFSDRRVDAAAAAARGGGNPGASRTEGPSSATTTTTTTKAKSKSQPSTPPPPPPATGPMILVYVNDRLGTRAEIPCLASDSVKAFKAMVAMKIGRAPHEILIKRQGERPFKDVLTLEDYGVSSGVQLDLEVDTGD